MLHAALRAMRKTLCTDLARCWEFIAALRTFIRGIPPRGGIRSGMLRPAGVDPAVNVFYKDRIVMLGAHNPILFAFEKCIETYEQIFFCIARYARHDAAEKIDGIADMLIRWFPMLVIARFE
jgi:hypothetical protein